MIYNINYKSSFIKNTTADEDRSSGPPKSQKLLKLNLLKAGNDNFGK